MQAINDLKGDENVMPRKIIITGKVIEINSGVGIKGLNVEAWDKDFRSKHIIGTALTNDEGVFKITFDQTEFAGVFKDKNPDVYFKVFDGERLLASTEREVYWNINNSKVDIVIKVFKENLVAINKNVIKGKVFHISKNPVPGIKVCLYAKELVKETLLKTTTTKKDGSYVIDIENNKEFSKKINSLYTIKVLDEKDSEIAISGMLDILQGELKQNFIISDEKYKGSSHFNNVLSKMAPYIKKVQINKLGKGGLRQEYHYLSKRTGLSKREVENYVRSQQLSEETGIAPDVFYVLNKYGFSGDLDHLISLDTDVLHKTFDRAKATNLVAPDAIGDSWAQVEKIKDVLVERVLKDKEDDESIAGILKIAVTKGSECKAVLKKYALGDAKGKFFWENLKAELGTGAETKISNIKKVLKLGVLAGNQKDITKELYSHSKEFDHKACIKKFVSLDADDFKEIIEKVSKEKKKLCVPSYIMGKTEEERIQKYAKAISLMLSKSFPTETFAARLEKQKNRTGAFAETADDLLKFVSQNKAFKFGEIEAADYKKYSFDDISDKEKLILEVKLLNRIFKLASDFEHISCLKALKYDSSFKIALMEKTAFIQNTKDKLTEAVAGSVYEKAQKISNAAFQMMAKLHPELGQGLAVVPGVKDTIKVKSDAEATWRTLFGNIEQVEVEESRAITSPAAYLADILHFLENHNKEAFDELKRRRGDILNLVLNHDNTMTPLPYIDLVIELMEKITVLTKVSSGADLNSSFQTTGSEDEIMAYPQNFTEQAYQILKDEVYPFSLPFNLPIEETRTYLSLLGMDRWEIIEEFLSFEKDDFCKKLSLFDWAYEYLGLSPKEADIITNTKYKPWLLFAFSASQNFKPIVDPKDSTKIITGKWMEVLTGRVDIFLYKTGLGYIELLGFLDTQAINPDREKMTVKVVSTVNPDTSDLSKIKIQGITKETLHKFNRLLRLWRKMDIPLRQLDLIIKALNINLDSSSDLLNLSCALYIIRNFNIPVEEAAAFWDNINVCSYIDYESDTKSIISSLFSRLFDRKSVQGEEPSILKQLIDPSKKVKIKECLDEITSSFGVGIDYLNEVLEVLEYNYEYDIGIAELSRIYRYFRFGRLLGIKAYELPALISLIGINPFENAKSCYMFIDKYSNITDNGFSLKDFYLIVIKKAEDLGSLETQIFINQLKKDLKALIEELPKNIPDESVLTGDESLRAYIVQKFAQKMRCDVEIIEVLLKNAKSFYDNSKSVLDDFCRKDFIDYSDEIMSAKESETLSVNSFVHIFEDYARVNKTVSLINKLKLDKVDVNNLYNGSNYLKVLHFDQLPVKEDCSDSKEQYVLFERLMNLLSVKKYVQDKSINFIGAHLGLLKANDFDSWVIDISSMLGCAKDDLEYLVKGSDSVLKVSFPEDFKDGYTIGKIASILKISRYMGMTADSLLPILEKDVTMEKVAALRKSCRGKFSDNDWYQRAKAARNKLRDKQREVLVDYVVSNPVASKKQYWTTKEELYEYLLLDVEVTSKVITSRLKQAIGSVQLFMDRILMNLERKYMSSVYTPFFLDEDSVKEWMSWRKNYRIWEANRKIFLYPENWIEPELRDDKSPFFKELDRQLKQSELTDEAVEDAFFKYLEKLDGVSRLDIKCFYKETDRDIIHVIGKNRSTPAKYYYRKRVDFEWMAWEPLDLEIFSDQVATVLWNRRLYVFWLECFEEPETGDVTLPSFENGGTVKKSRTRLKIQLAWSYRWQNRWSGKHLSQAPIYTQYYDNISISDIKNSLFLSTQCSDTKLFVRPLTLVKYLRPGLVFNPSEGIERVYVSVGEKFVFYDCTSDPKIESDNFSQTNGQLLLPEDASIEKMHVESENKLTRFANCKNKTYIMTTDKG